MMTITSNERFEIRSLDFKNAYLQGSKIGRTVYIEPPSDYKKEGKIWLILRNVYGTNDSTTNWYGRPTCKQPIHSREQRIYE